MPIDALQQWEAYRELELRVAEVLLGKLGFDIEPEQPHTGGERFLMVGERDVGGGGYKLVLLGARKTDGKRVVIKISSDPNGILEIQTERRARETLRTLRFAYQSLRAPAEILYSKHGEHIVFITEYIEHEHTFLSYPMHEQFFLALQAFKAQESIYATTYAHAKVVRSAFGIWGADEYLSSFDMFRASATGSDSENTALAESLSKAHRLLDNQRDVIEQYSGFLTHADFVPHNLRICDGQVYLLDSASLHFGNKYESWARFLNFMLLHHQPLEGALLQYVQDNRTPKEVASLRLMRIYKLGKLLEYHAGALSKTEGNLHTLSKKRVEFWREVLESLLNEQPFPKEKIAAYQNERDSLRSDEEKKRQVALH